MNHDYMFKINTYFICIEMFLFDSFFLMIIINKDKDNVSVFLVYCKFN